MAKRPHGLTPRGACEQKKAKAMTAFIKSDLFRNFSIGFSAGLFLVFASQTQAFAQMMGA